MISPTIAAIKEATNTAAADRSLIVPASWLYSGLTKSTSFSIAVFTISRHITPAVQIRITDHSVGVMPRTADTRITTLVETRCSTKFRSLQAARKPLKAKRKDRNIECLPIKLSKVTIFAGFNGFYYLCNMKRIVFAIGLLVFILQACEEVPPYIDFTAKAQAKDTTYVNSTVPQAQHKAVLIEDITGVRCNNCPDAAQKAKDIINTKTEDSVVAIALYTSDMPTLTGPYSGYPVLTSNISTQMVQALGLPSAIPNGYIDRHVFSPQTVRYNTYTSWPNLVNQRLLGATTPVNITIEKTLTNRKLSLKIKLEYTQSVPDVHKVAVYLTESGIISNQLMKSGENHTYAHNHVLRDVLSHQMLGDALNAPLVPGRTFEKLFEYEVPVSYTIDNCHIVCVVSNSNTEDVVNVRQAPIN